MRARALRLFTMRDRRGTPRRRKRRRVLAINAEAAPLPRSAGSTAIETISARCLCRMQVTIYPQMRVPRTATRNRVPAFVGIFCKQVAIVRIFAEAGVFDLQDPVQIRSAGMGARYSAWPSVILYFGALGGRSTSGATEKTKETHLRVLTRISDAAHTETMMQLSGNSSQPEVLPATLVDLRRGDAAILDRIDLPSDDARRLMELGFLPGHANHRGIERPGRRPARLPGGWFGNRAAPRDRPAPEGPAGPHRQTPRTDERVRRLPRLRHRPRSLRVPAPGSAVKTVALVGPPNSGKTTLFNRLTGLRQKVANFPGVTVEQHTGIAELPDGRAVSIDRSARASTASRRARKTSRSPTTCCTGKRADTPKPEAVLLVLDSTNLGRHLMLAAPILALGLPTLIILNMADDLRNRGGKLDLRSALRGTRRAGGADQRARRRRHRPGLRFSGGRHAQAGAQGSCRSCRTCPSAARGPGG